MNACHQKWGLGLDFYYPKEKREREENNTTNMSWAVLLVDSELRSADEEIFAFNLVEIIVIHMIVYYATFNDLRMTGPTE